METGQKNASQVAVSVIILTWNSERQIRACLASLNQGLSAFSSEVIVVDNGSRDRTCAIVRETRPDAQLLCNPDNRGVAPARNQGIRLAQGEYILILDDDTVVQPGALDSLIRYMEDQPEVGLCGPKLTDADGELQLSCRWFPTLADKLARRLPLAAARKVTCKVEMADWDHQTIRAVDYVIGACQVIRRRAIQEVGPFDERIFYGPEDVDMCLRLQQAGWQVTYNPDAVVVHKERRLTRSLRSDLMWKTRMGTRVFFLEARLLAVTPPAVREACPVRVFQSGLKGSPGAVNAILVEKRFNNWHDDITLCLFFLTPYKEPLTAAELTRLQHQSKRH